MIETIPASTTTDRWWAVALSEEVLATKPLSAHIGQNPVVLWRDAQGHARALEDRCPHRRAPLSLGCVKDNGHLQCGYHGWIFEGESGRVQAIPNAKEQTKFPPLYRAMTYAVREAGGFVWANANAAATDAPLAGEGGAFHGAARVAMGHRQYIETLLDGPHLLMAIPGIRFTEYFLADPEWIDGRLVMDRNCMWRRPTFIDRFRSEWDFSMRIALDPYTGFAEMTLRGADMLPLLRIDLAPTPSRRDATVVRWRARFDDAARGWRPQWVRLLAGVGRGPVHIFNSVDAAALEKLLEGPSVAWHHFLATSPQPGPLAAAV